jgi:membrane associated rhomboid family serine protease
MFLPYSDEAPREGRLPWMNWLLILANVLIFFMLARRPDYESIVREYGFTPANARPVTFFTSLFLHGSILHVAGNMWFLYLFGDNVESRCGSFAYLVAYLVCGLAGDASHYAFFKDSLLPSIGASGAVFGVMGMYVFFFPHNRIKVLYFFIIFIGTVTIRALWVIGLFALMEFLSSRAQARAGAGGEGGVGHLAHAGGFIAGAFMAGLYSAFSPRAGARSERESGASEARFRMIRDGDEE